MSGIHHLVNQTPIEWYCNKQTTAVSATYSSEFITSQTTTDEIIDLWYTLNKNGSTTRLPFLCIW